MDDHEAAIDLGIAGLGPAEHIGRGGFADVYRAEQFSLRRTVAVKVLRAQASDSDAEARFERECHAIGAVSDHPHIVGVHEGGFTRNGRAYLVMEYLPGGSLYERLVDDGPLPVPEIVDIGIKIGKALAVAHRTGVLHRDVKPANIMISAYGEPALGDFGIARVEGGHQTATGLVTASFAHAAPEVLEGNVPSASADIYSLGSTMFELMAGQPPYFSPEDESIWPLMKRILSEPMPSPESIGMSPRLGAVFSRATARDLSQRYVEADELVNDLVEVASDPLAVTVYPPGSDAFVPAPRPPGGRKGRIDPSNQPHGGLPHRLPPAAKPDLRPATVADTGLTQPMIGGDVAAHMFREGQPGAEPSVLYPPSTPAVEAPAVSPQTSTSPTVLSVGADSSAPATTMDLPPTAVAQIARVEPRGWLVPLVGFLAAIVVMTGALVVFTDLADPVIEAIDPAAPSTDSTAPSIGTVSNGLVPGDAEIEMAAALDGPVAADSSYPVAVTGFEPGRLVEFVIDGSPTGDVVEVASDGSVLFAAPAGRHSLALAEQATQAQAPGRTVSNTVVFYGLPPSGPAEGYRVTLASVAAEPTAWADALAAYERLVAGGHENLELIVSDSAPALTPGYWTISVTGFDADALAAEAYCARFDLQTPTDCYVSFIDGARS